MTTSLPALRPVVRPYLEVGGPLTRCKTRTCGRFAANWFFHTLICKACGRAYCLPCMNTHDCEVTP